MIRNSLLWLSIALVFLPTSLFADEYDPLSSPFEWSALISNYESGEPKSLTYEFENIDMLFKHGVKNKALNTSCTFQFEKKLDSQPNSKQTRYLEMVWITCQIGEVQLALNAISCSKNMQAIGQEFEIDSGGPKFERGGAALSVHLDCISKPPRARR